jgi:hypothetical protein
MIRAEREKREAQRKGVRLERNKCQRHTFADREGHRDDAVRARLAVEAANKVGHVVEHAKVMLDKDDVAGRRDEARVSLATHTWRARVAVASHFIRPGSSSLVILSQRADYPGCHQTLSDVKVGGRLVEHEHSFVLNADHGAGEALQLAARQLLDVAIQKLGELQLLAHKLRPQKERG